MAKLGAAKALADVISSYPGKATVVELGDAKTRRLTLYAVSYVLISVVAIFFMIAAVGAMLPDPEKQLCITVGDLNGNTSTQCEPYQDEGWLTYLSAMSSVMGSSTIFYVGAFGAVIAIIGFLAVRRRALLKNQLSAMHRDRPYALFFRSFQNDTADQFTGISRLETAVVSALTKSFASRREEPWCVLAIDNVNVKGVTGGAIRVQTAHDTWKAVVRRLLLDARVAIIDARTMTPGLRDEIAYGMSKEGGCAHILIMLADTRNDQLARHDGHALIFEAAGTRSTANIANWSSVRATTIGYYVGPTDIQPLQQRSATPAKTAESLVRVFVRDALAQGA